MNKGRINSTESFGSVDGPGVRFVVFLQGCMMRCRYCHNPETWDLNKGKLKSADELLETALKYKTYWGTDGGITVSGGEPLLQIDFVIEFFEKAKAKGIHTTLDTAGYQFRRDHEFLEKFRRLMQVTDLFMLDLKIYDEVKHKALTSCSNNTILDMAKYLSDNHKDMWIRHVLVPGITDDEKDLQELSSFVKTLKSVKRFEVLPYHNMAMAKWDMLGITYTLKDVLPPKADQVARAEQILDTDSYNAYKL